MYNAAISADVVASSSLRIEEIDHLTQRIYWLFDQIEAYKEKEGKVIPYRRLVAGDLIEYLITDPADALRIALILKTGIKSFILEDNTTGIIRKQYRSLFTTYGVRVAVGIGEMNWELVDKDILNGEAISRSGRLIAQEKTSNKERVSIKNTLFFDSPIPAHTELFTTMLALVDELLNKATQRQCATILYKLLGYNENDIATELKIPQSTVNVQSRAAGWSAIEQAVKYYSNFNFQESRT